MPGSSLPKSMLTGGYEPAVIMGLCCHQSAKLFISPILIANETHFHKLRSLNLRPLVETLDTETLPRNGFLLSDQHPEFLMRFTLNSLGTLRL